MNQSPVGLQAAKLIVSRIGISFGAGSGKIREESLIPILQAVQEEYGYLPEEVLVWISAQTGIPLSRMYGVITFYAQFSLTAKGKHQICACRGTACHVRGGKKIIHTITGVLGIAPGATREDNLFSFETVACLGTCALAPTLVVNSTYYGKMTQRKAEQILRQLEDKEQS